MPPLDSSLWRQQTDYLLSRGLLTHIASDNLWYPSSAAGDTSPRIVIPATAGAGNIFWQARAMDDNPKRYQSPHAPRGDAVVLVWPSKLHPAKRAVIVEGPMDALAAASLGFLGVGLMGITPPDGALSLVCRMVAGMDIALVADKDQVDGMMKVMGRILSRIRGKVELLVSYPFKDLADAPPAFRKELLL